MDYQETVHYLFNRLPLFSRIGAAAYKSNLDNIIQLCSTLHNPQQHFKTIHIAGTNGKGSVSHMLAAILQTAGYKTGLYTSPHLKDFRERIQIDGTLVSSNFVVDFTEKIQPQIETIQPSFFEITVAMAFDYFAQEKVDVAIIETGMGGRLDSTNIISPLISIITNISLDHTQFLGKTIDKIATEKAGIIKEKAPVVIGETSPLTQPVFEKKAKEKNAPIYFADQLYTINNTIWENNQLSITVIENSSSKKNKYTLDLPGIYQKQNIKTVLTAVELLRKNNWHITPHHLAYGLQHVKALTHLHGRWEIICTSPLVVLDIAHNANGIEQLGTQIRHTPHKHLHIILGMVKDKDHDEVLKLFPEQATYYFSQANIPRALPAQALQEKATNFNLKGFVFQNVNDALQQALHNAAKEDLILVCGSVFLIAEIDDSFIPNRTS